MSKFKLILGSLTIPFEVVADDAPTIPTPISETPKPTPSPVPTPDPVPVPTPTPAPAPTPPAAPIVARYVSDFVETLAPSYKGASIGKFADILTPVGEGAGTTTLIDRIQPPRAFPCYMELQFDRISRAEGLADEGSTLKARGANAKKYIELLRSMGVEPIKQNMAGIYPLDWDLYKDYGCSFRQLVLDGAIYAPCIFGPAPSLVPPDAFLAKVEAAIKSGELPKDSWCYAWDEGEGDATATAQALARVKLIRAKAPSLKIKITRRRTVEFSPYVDVFFPVFEFMEGGYVPASPDGVYGSCMAQGSCTTGAPGVPTGTPMLGCVEAPYVHSFAYPVVAFAMGAKEILYYSVSEKIESALKPGGLMFAAGNGDGTLVYPGARPSMRLYGIKEGLDFIAAYLGYKRSTCASDRLKQLVISTTVWEKNISTWRGVASTMKT